MQLSFDVRIPDGLLAANALLNEKPHQGVPSWNLALHQGIDERNSTAAIGIRASAQLNRIRSRYTGKERDTESGLDYFGARYYSSNMGRFSSPDQSGLYFANATNPQSLNLYSYVRNNPLINIDPTGLDCIHTNVDTGAYEGFERGDCDNSTEEKANSGQYVDGTVNTIYTTTGDKSGRVTGYDGAKDDGSGTLISGRYLDPTRQDPDNARITALVDGIAIHTNSIIDSLPLPCAVGGAFYIGNGRLGGGQSLDTQAGRQNAFGFNFISAGGFKVNYTVNGGAAGNISYVIPTPFKAYGVPLGVEVGTNNGDALHSIQSVALVTNGPGLRNFSAYVNLRSVGSGCHP